jgi:hypothetical protein
VNSGNGTFLYFILPCCYFCFSEYPHACSK